MISHFGWKFMSYPYLSKPWISPHLTLKGWNKGLLLQDFFRISKDSCLWKNNFKGFLKGYYWTLLWDLWFMPANFFFTIYSVAKIYVGDICRIEWYGYRYDMDMNIPTVIEIWIWYYIPTDPKIWDIILYRKIWDI